MNPGNKTIPNLLIVSLTPYFLEKEAVWFTENREKILSAQKSQTFFQDNTLYIEEGQRISISEILRKLDEMGYERVFDARDMGELSQQGGVLDIFPINLNHAVRLDFLGNTLERILVSDTSVEDEKKAKEILQKRLKSQKIFSDIKNLNAGDFLVHLDHGVGKFVGMEKLGEHEYYKLAYSHDDTLYVPVGLERKLSRYVGFADPGVARLGSTVWQTTKRKIKEEVEQLAKTLLLLYAKKEQAVRQPYTIDTAMEGQLNASFPYNETPDQLQAMEDIKKDLEKEKPMDRIVLGDVGFGKTEVAIRAAFLAATNNYQTAVICPTTILASQHYENFKKRLSSFPITVGLLSRLQTEKEQRHILKATGEGKVDILIGTHRLLSNDVSFKRLQLLVIDDEQRFGVKQKEKLREKNPAVDLLSLSATPIPRTVYLALASFKNMSVIQTPPEGRTAIKTKVLPYSISAIEKAITHELDRKGQIYFLHNRVSSIEGMKKKLQDLLPQARIGVIHGRMHEKQLITVMKAFEKHELDILISTTIIENGIDLANANTIIIEDASRLGLSQAYQIRGRVGRSHKESFAYFFHPKKVPPLAKERLQALEEAKELGAGYRIAMKDLELRGAGNILGKEQSGAINKIGLNLYAQMLSEAVEKLRQ